MALKGSGQLTLTDLNDVTTIKPTIPKDGNLWYDGTDLWIYKSASTSWEKVSNYEDYVQSRGENLVTNGTGLLGNNTNFSQFTFDSAEVFAGGGSFYTASGEATKFNDELIPVDTTRTYRFSLMAKSKTAGGKNYFGIGAYDIDGNVIVPYMFYGSQFTPTTLATDLKVGDTVINLTSSVGFMDDSATPDHRHSIVFWGYKNSKGYTYPDGTYSRKYFSTGWNKTAINRTTHVITLSRPFDIVNPNDPQGIWRAGHKVSPTYSGGNYQYMTAGNVNVPTTWTNYSGLITGNGITSNSFPHGTAFIKLLFLVNRVSSGGIAGDAIWFNSLSFTDLTEIDEIQRTLGNMANDNVIDIKERQVVKDKLVEILGYTIADTATTLPTTATLDASLKGTFYNSRKSAVNAGITSADTAIASGSTTYGATYDAVVTKYNALKTYLEGLTPIDVWDVRSTNKDINPTVVKTTWRDTWQAYYQAEKDLDTATAKKLKENVDNITVGGRNIIKNTGLIKDSTGFTLVSGVTRDTTLLDGGVNTFKYAVTGRATDGWLSASPVYYPCKAGDVVSASADIYIPTGHGIDLATPTLEIQFFNASGTRLGTATIGSSLTTLDAWQRIKREGAIAPATTTQMNARVWIQRNGSFNVGKLKLEAGNKATDWTPAIEDLEGRVIDVESAVTPTSIVNTVTGSQTWVTTMNTIDDNITSSGQNLIYNSIADIKNPNGDTDQWTPTIRQNLAQGTAIPFTGTGTGITNQTFPMYDIDYSLVYNKTITISFDAVCSVNSGTFSVQWSNTPWGTLGANKTASTTSKHYIFTGLQNLAGTATGIQLRMDSITGTVTISNLKIEIGSSATVWNIAPEDNVDATGTMDIGDFQDGYQCFRTDNANTATEMYTASKWFPVLPSTKYTIRFLAKQTANMSSFDVWFLSRKSGSTLEQGVAWDYTAQPLASKVASTSGFTEFKATFTTRADDIDGYIRFDNNKSTNGENSTLWIAELKLERGTIATQWSRSLADLDSQITVLQTNVSNVKQVIDADSIINTVTQSVTFTNALADKADSDSLSGFATSEDLKNLDISGAVDDKMTEYASDETSILNKTFATKGEVTQTSKDLTAKFSATGGMNLLKNSIGFSDFITRTEADAGLKNWFVQGVPARVQRVQTTALDTLGFGSGFQFSGSTAGQNTSIDQYVTVIPNVTYTLSWYAQKTNQSPVSATNSDGELQIFMYESDGSTRVNLNWSKEDATGTLIDYTGIGYAYENEEVVSTFEAQHVTFTPTTSRVQLRLYGYGLLVATITGLMFTIGDIPLQWTLATGEAYNTNVRLDINGIRVSQLDASKVEVGFTQISPSEFAGYYDSNGDGSFEKIFYLNGEETVSKKVRALQEFSMGTMKITKVPSAVDWQELYPYAINDKVAVGAKTYRCTVGGVSSSTPPIHTTGTATDGSVTWQYENTSSYIGWAYVPVS